MLSKIEQDRQCPQIPDREEDVGPVVFSLPLSHGVKWYIVGSCLLWGLSGSFKGKIISYQGKGFQKKMDSCPSCEGDLK